LRIGLFHPTLNMYGGAEVVAVATANSLFEHGHEVVLYVNTTLDQKRIKEMVGESLCPCKVVISPTFLKPRGMFHLYESGVRSLVSKQCDLLIDTYSCYVYPWVEISYIHFPFWNAEVFSHKFPYLKKYTAQNALTIPYIMFEKTLENYSSKLLFANSYYTSRAIKESLGVNSTVLYPPIPNAFFEGQATSEKGARQDLVVSVGRFGYGKGVELVPEIASCVDKKIRFVMIGLAHEMAIVEAVKRRVKELNLEDRFSVLTNASRETIIHYLSIAKVYLHTMKGEHFGISIAEAMAMGCIPIVHNSGGAPEFVPDEYRYNNLIQASDRIKKAIDNWDLSISNNISLKAQQFSEANYSRRFIEVFEKYLENNPEQMPVS
jgi:glycosyltransferase involved in cell wall biosynthesis